jgi:glycosyltransferase involved in cell wall biosynthesis
MMLARFYTCTNARQSRNLPKVFCKNTGIAVGGPLRLCIFAPVMRRHRGYFTPHSGLIARTLANLGHEVTVLTAELPEGGGAVEVEDGVTVHYLADTPPSKQGGAFWTNSAIAFDRLHDERPFDIVFGRGKAVFGFLRHSRHADAVPVILHEGTYPFWLHQIETRLGWLGRPLGLALAPVFAWKNRDTWACLRRAARVVCITPQLAAALRRAYWWNPPRSIALTYGFDTSPFHPVPPVQPARLISIGRVTWDKGVLPMLEVFARLKTRTAGLEVIGPGSDKVRRTLLKRATELGVQDRYSLPGAAQNEELPAHLAGATAFLFPSTHAEGLGKVVLEAMAAGVPVVAYRLPVLEGIIDDGVTGFLVPMRSVAEMADRVDRLIGDPALVQQMGAAARRKIEADFSPAIINVRWQALLTEVVTEATTQRES